MLEVRADTATPGMLAPPVTPRFRLSRRQTVLVLLEVAGHRYGMGIAVVSDVHALHRIGATADWRPATLLHR